MTYSISNKRISQHNLHHAFVTLCILVNVSRKVTVTEYLNAKLNNRDRIIEKSNKGYNMYFDLDYVAKYFHYKRYRNKQNM